MMLRYELAKLLKNRTFLLLAAALLFGNILFLLQTERSREITEKTAEEREAYIASYTVFLNEMEDRVEEMEQSRAFSGKTSFVYRNLEKTAEDFRALSGVAIEPGDDVGVRAFAGYGNGMLFLLLFLVLVVYIVYYDERNKGIFLLLKGTKNGHAPLLAVKAGTSMLVTAVYLLLQEGSVIACYGALYGYGNLSRALQSVSEFRNCPYRISVGGFLLLSVCVRILVAWTLLAVFTVFAVRIRNELLGVLAIALFLGLEFVAERGLTAGSSLNYFYCVNPFFWWDMERMVGSYLNLNVFGYAVGKDAASAVVAAACVLVCAAASAFWFHTLCQFRTESRLEAALLFLRKKTAWRWRHTNLFRFEWTKIFSLQKKGVVLAAVALFCVCELYSTSRTVSYSTPELAAYHGYLNRLSGKVTEESLAYVDEQEARIADLYAQLEELASETSADASLKAQAVSAQLKQIEGGFQMVTDQLSALKAKDGELAEKYWVDEESYFSVWKNYRTDILYWAVSAAAIVLWTSGIHAFDRKKGLMFLLDATKRGGKERKRKERRCAWCGTVCVILFLSVPALYRYAKIDGFSVLSQKLCDFTRASMDSEATLGVFLLLLFLGKILSLLAVSAATYVLAEKTADEMTVNLVGIGVAGALALAFLGFRMNFAMLLLRLLCGYAVF